ncbi:hypothetical protein NT239_12565 [Chitinibacter sp. SCUT-21]|uniref:hypothetical protein n=1 Tax=Chitinibacter sp. SCUT-21 TaxID=2970891 RepID=UPI0035A576E4
MSLVLDVFTQWRDPAIRTQRDWLFTLFWGRTSNQRMIWPLAYMLLLCWMWIFPVNFVLAMYLPLAFLAFAPSMNTAMLLCALERWRVRKPYCAVMIAQALLLNGLVWGLIGLMFWYRTSSPTVLLVMGFAWLLGQFMAFAMPQAFAKRSFTPVQGQTWQVQLVFTVMFIPLLGLTLAPQYEFWIGVALLLCSMGLIVALLVHIQRFGQPRSIQGIHMSKDTKRTISPVKSPLLFRVEMNLGFALDAKGWRKLFNSLILTPYGMILAYQHFLPIQGVNQWGAGAIFAMQMGACLVYFSGRRQWSNAWLRRSNSRSQLWLQDEQLFLAGLVLIAGLNCGLLLLLGMDGLTQIVNAALLFVVGMSLLRYVVQSFPLLNLYGLNANGRSDMQGVGLAFILLMPIWMVVAWIWGKGVQDQIEIMIFCLATPIPFFAYFSYRYALKIDLGAMRRAKLN